MGRLLTQYHKINASDYQDVWDFQTILHNKVKNAKLKGIAAGDYGKDKPKILNHLVFCEHLPVYTLGKSAKASNLLIEAERAKDSGYELFQINRGGDITFHGPGQLTGYLILDVELLYRDIHRYVRTIEEAIIILLRGYGIQGERLSDFTGVWVREGNLYSKVCAIGVHLSRWVSMHGFGLNVSTDLSHFKNMIPCGITDDNKQVTSIAKLLGYKISTDEVEQKLVDICSELFQMDIKK